MKRIKQVLLIRRDLNMRRGKEIAQGSHAAIGFLVENLRGTLAKNRATEVMLELSPDEATWLLEGMAKVCLKVNSEAELVDLHKKAEASGLPSHLVQDSGRTEFHGRPTFTACAIGPADGAAIDAVTGDLVPY